MLKNLLALAAAAVACGAFAAVPESVIKVRELGNDVYRLELKSYRSASVEEGQVELRKKAGDLCGGKHTNYGKYKFDMTEPVGAAAGGPKLLLLQQEISCHIPPAALAPSAPVAVATVDLPASEEQIKRVEGLTSKYFAAKDQGRYQEAYDMQAASQKAVAPFAQFKERVEAFNARAGAARNRSVKKVTWYRNPPQVAPGLYAAVDFTSEFANLVVHCGFVAWHQQPDGNFLVVREEENSVDKVTAHKMTTESLDEVRAQFRCK